MRIKLVNPGPNLRDWLSNQGHEVDKEFDYVLVRVQESDEVTLSIIRSFKESGRVIVLDYGGVRGRDTRCRDYFFAGACKVFTGPTCKEALQKILAKL